MDLSLKQSQATTDYFFLFPMGISLSFWTTLDGELYP